MELTHDSATNTLRLTLANHERPVDPTHTTNIDAILDIGEGGRLIGVEFPADEAQLSQWLRDPIASAFVTHEHDGRAYIQITTASDGTARSTPIRVTVEYNADGDLTALAIPRRGHGYEVSYPSGNQ